MPVGWIESPVHLHRNHVVFSVSDRKYICHSHCRDLLHLDDPPQGRWPRCVSASEVRHSRKRDNQVSRDASGSGNVLSVRPSVPHAGRKNLWLTKVASGDQICVHSLSLCSSSRPTEREARLWVIIVDITCSVCQ